MASDGANEEPYASEYAGKGSPNNSDNDEGTNVEHNASVTKLLTTQGIRDSNESTNADAENIVAMDTLKQLNTLLMRKGKRPLTQEERDQLAGLVERGLDILDLMSEGDAESAPPQETRPADGSSSERPLDMEDGNRKTSTQIREFSWSGVFGSVPFSSHWQRKQLCFLGAFGWVPGWVGVWHCHRHSLTPCLRRNFAHPRPAHLRPAHLHVASY